MKKVCLALSLVLASLFLGVLSLAAPSSASEKETLVYVNFRDIRDLNPHLYGGELYAQNLLYESLVKITPDGIEPWLAESWEISDDGRVYTFHLRRDVAFSDGEPFDAAAAKANFDAVLDNIERHGWLEMVRLMEGVDAVDDHTLRIRLKEPYFPMLTELGVTRPMRFISPRCMKEGTTKKGVTGHIGTGPYVLAENVVDQQATFVRNENYWGEKPSIRTIKVRVIPDNQTRVLALEKGEIDLIYGKNMIDADTLERFRGKKGFVTSLSDPVSTRMLLLNTTKGALTQREVRQALQHAVDKKALSEGIFNGIESPADTVLARTVPYCDVDLKSYAFDLEAAGRLLDEAGWVREAGRPFRSRQGETLQMTLLYNSNSVSEKTLSEYFQSLWAELGVDLKILGEEEQSYRDRQKAGDFDIVFNISWGTPYDPQSFLSAMRTVVYGDYAAQQGLACKADLDDRIARVLVTTDADRRQELFTSILTTLHEEAVYLPLTYERNRAIFSDRVLGVTYNPSQFEVPFEKMSLAD
ncbi:nickel ABC transporter substrate-binding protein [Aminithiophilus ramosus]|uniref:Nickel ABC transporter substrate-binding protein n=2 Tax=Synergistales TaxID=649776 RepID=A0A9Q7ACV3_9BACT|nr:nickel ABC transporter substrate-binding protein [Aminithiophilus ramosus]QTX32538.1 nickel ABC transporter substrate-binding protein [Aminithiophilus ramosus]QVL36418.1 nickel ABC transporter substrate-binding protein [Synergistota bacterium]